MPHSFIEWGRPLVCAGRLVPLFSRRIKHLQHRTGRPGAGCGRGASAPQFWGCQFLGKLCGISLHPPISTVG